MKEKDLENGGEPSDAGWFRDSGTEEAELQVAKMKMLRFSLEAKWMVGIRNEYFKGTAHVRCFTDKDRLVTQMSWTVHIPRRTLTMEARRFTDVVKGDVTSRTGFTDSFLFNVNGLKSYFQSDLMRIM